MGAQKLGPWSGVYHPDYHLKAYRDGDPSQQITGVNLRSVTSLTTNKTLDDVSGSFSVTLKDRRAQHLIGPMDVLTIRLKGHNQGWGKVFVGVVDSCEPAGQADTTSAEADVIISGRCTGKYLQVNSMFLPVWDPAANLPTALLFGMGAAANLLGDNLTNVVYPRTIFGAIFDRFVVGRRNLVGESGTPNARYWMSRSNRFQWVRNGDGGLFKVPYIQFDESTCDTALTSLVVQGFTEGWVDEVGNIVYRRPQWDQPVSWNLSTGGLLSWDLPKADDTVATYVEVIPGGLPGISAANAQAMMAGRAPVPSDYVVGLQKSGFRTPASPEFIIDTDPSGKVTANGARNWYYQRQKKYGVRPYQITSPLLASRAQAQAQAEGLLRFLLRWDKSGTITIPGEPGVRLGQTIYLHGRLDDQLIARSFYVEGVAQEYVEGQYYQTRLTLTHGRDPGDPSFQQMVLPNLSVGQLADNGGGGVLSAPVTPSSGTGSSATGESFPIPARLTGIRAAVLATTLQALQMGDADWTYSNIGRPQPAAVTSWGALKTPISTDCSGFVTLVYKIGGAPDPNGLGYRQAGYTGYMEGQGTPTNSPQPGDLCFWSSPDHVALYVGNGQIVEHGGATVALSTVTAESPYHQSFLGFRSYLP